VPFTADGTAIGANQMSPADWVAALFAFRRVVHRGLLLVASVSVKTNEPFADA
jgi:hypothetical protein